MNTNIINTAVSNVNAERTLEAVRKAQGIIGSIERENTSLTLLKKSLSENQEALAKLAQNEVTFEKVLGKAKPTTPTASEATIIKSIEAIVESRQKDVETRSTGVAQQIANSLDAVKATEKRIADLRAELDKVSADSLTAAAIVG